MTAPEGEWVWAENRRDWVPTEQPPSPDGSLGLWHVVVFPEGTERRWEWHPAPSDWTPPPAPKRLSGYHRTLIALAVVGLPIVIIAAATAGDDGSANPTTYTEEQQTTAVADCITGMLASNRLGADATEEQRARATAPCSDPAFTQGRDEVVAERQEREREFMEDAKSRGLSADTDEKLVGAGRATCKLLLMGQTLPDVIAALVAGTGLTYDQSKSAVEVAVKHFCTSQQYKVS